MGIFVGIYLVELLLRLFVTRHHFKNDRTNGIDAIVIPMDLLFQILHVCGIGSMPPVAVLRILRIFKIIKSSPSLRRHRELYLLVSGLDSAMKAVVSASVMILIWFLMWSIVAVELIHPVNVRVAENGLYDDCERCPRAFGSVGAALLTLVQQLIAGDSWGTTALPVLEENPWCWLFFFTVLVTTQLGIFNLVIGTIVDAVDQARESDLDHQRLMKETQNQDSRKNLVNICKAMDTDGSGQITLPELLTGFDNDDAFATLLELMDICRDDLSLVFSMMDVDKSGAVDYDEFIEQLHHIKTQDSHTTMMFINYHLSEVSREVSEELGLVKRGHGAQDEKLSRILELLGEPCRVAAECPVGNQPTCAESAGEAPPTEAPHAEKARPEPQLVEQAPPVKTPPEASSMPPIPSIDSLIEELGRLHRQISKMPERSAEQCGRIRVTSVLDAEVAEASFTEVGGAFNHPDRDSSAIRGVEAVPGTSGAEADGKNGPPAGSCTTTIFANSSTPAMTPARPQPSSDR
eukprot:NODE_304_length_1685_cov_284.204908.p1 GENE.NODE_304_length_1685_cov_284.204908~~NODE_304_length_1685_cov_284.204908.p1  ORF type:complete len:519 (+),score=165.06 NODE_304_length_1685_cov_284.204908:3-1559(+)